MAVPHCSQAYLIKGTGIGSNQYMFWESKQACDAWFLAKKSDISIQNYSRIYGEAVSKNKYNVACIIVDAPLNDTLFCDYISFLNDDAQRWFHAAITNREFVSDNATRLYFAIDYVATYWDTIQFKECFVERITGEEAPYTNLLSEPISVNIIETPASNDAGLNPGNAVEVINTELSKYSFIVVCDMSNDGALNQPQVQWYGGYPYGGYVDRYDDATGLSDVKKRIQGVIQRQQNLLAKTTATASTVPTILVAPQKATQEGTAVGLVSTSVDCPARGKWNKTKNYQYAKIRAATGAELMLDPKVFGKATIALEATFYGGPSGCCKVSIAESMNSYAYFVESPTWGQMQFAGTGADGDTVLPTPANFATAISERLKHLTGG